MNIGSVFHGMLFAVCINHSRNPSFGFASGVANGMLDVDSSCVCFRK